MYRFANNGESSPLLANVFLYYAFDLWIESWRKNRSLGDVVVIRYANLAAMRPAIGSLAVKVDRNRSIFSASRIAAK